MTLKEILNKGFAVLMMRSLGAGLAFLLILLFARWLGVEQFGLFSLGLTLVMILGVISRWGLEQVTLKQVAAHLKNEPGIAKGYVTSGLKLSFIFSLIVAVFLWGTASWLELSVFQMIGLENVLINFALSIIFISVVFILAEAFKAIGLPVWASFFQSVMPPTSILLVAGYLHWNDVFKVQDAAVTYSLGFAFTFLIALVFWKKKAPDGQLNTIPKRDLIKQGWPMLLVASGALIMNWSDLIIAGIYLDEVQVGIYNAASKTVMVTILMLVAVNSLTAPKFAKFYKQNDLKAIASLAQLSSLVLLVTVSIPTAILLFFSEWVMGWFGSEYVSGATVLMILAVGQFVNVACGSVGYLLTMTGKENTMRNIMLTTAIVNIVLSISLVEYYGILGIAIATAISMSLWNVWAMIEVRKQLGFWTISLNLFLQLINRKKAGLL